LKIIEYISTTIDTALAKKRYEGSMFKSLFESSGTLVKNYFKDNLGWSGGDDAPHRLDESQRESLLTQARLRYYQNPHARAVIRGLRIYTIGKNLELAFGEDDKEPEELWDSFSNDPSNRLKLRIKEMIERLFRDGETIIRFFDNPDTSRPWPVIRLLRPEYIKNPPHGVMQANIHDGIEFDGDDVETAVAYYYSSNGKDFEIIPADQILHWKINCDSDTPRGRSILEPLLNAITRHEEWVVSRAVLSKVRNSVVMIRKVAQNVGAALGITKTENTKKSDGTSTEDAYKMIKPGSVFSGTKGIDYQMASPNLQAQDAQHDGRMLILLMCAATGFPEFFFGDSNAGNYATALMAESPMVRMMEDWQDTIEYYVKDMIRKVLEHSGWDYECASEAANLADVGWPSLVHRDWSDEVDGMLKLYVEEIISRRDVQMRTGFDPDATDIQMDKEGKVKEKEAAKAEEEQGKRETVEAALRSIYANKKDMAESFFDDPIDEHIEKIAEEVCNCGL